MVPSFFSTEATDKQKFTYHFYCTDSVRWIIMKKNKIIWTKLRFLRGNAAIKNVRDLGLARFYLVLSERFAPRPFSLPRKPSSLRLLQPQR